MLEFLRRTEIVRASGEKIRLLDAVGVITGVSGGSFTALAYGLYGDKLFAEYEQRFLKRDVQGEIIARAFNPGYWARLGSPNWGRSELAADLYDEILFNGATYADLGRGKGPLILASATDVSTGARMVFDQDVFDALCSNLDDFRLSRAAAASSAVPVVLSAVTLNNYGGTCNYVVPARAAIPVGARAARRERPSVRSARSTNGWHSPTAPTAPTSISWTAALPTTSACAACLPRWNRWKHCIAPACRHCSTACAGSWFSSSTRCPRPGPIGTNRRRPPGAVSLLLQASGVPIEHYSYESVELLRDKAARWQSLRRLRNSPEFAASTNPAIADELEGPDVDIYAIDVSFAALKDKAEFEYLNGLPTSFVLPDEAVDRLRAAAGDDHHGLARSSSGW